MRYKDLEQQLADKLYNRTIAPSQDAWRRIAHSRQQNKNKNKSRKLYPYYVAASIISVVSAGLVYMFTMGEGDFVEEPRVVRSYAPAVDYEANEAPGLYQRELPVSQGIATTGGTGINTVSPVNPIIKEVKPANLVNTDINENLSTVNIINLPQYKAGSVSRDYDQEAALLLNNAIKELAADKVLPAAINDTALLREVEAEMDEYYRDKAMKVFSLKHKAIRIAVEDKQ